MNVDDIAPRREALGISRPDLAAAAGIGHATLWRWETGRARPHGAQLRAVEAALIELERKHARNAAVRARRAARSARRNDDTLE